MALSPAYERHPQHTLVFADELAGIRVALGELVLAETRSGLILREGSYPETVYIPREDCDMDRLIRNQATTHCPFKGDATYYDFEPPASATTSAKPETKVEQICWSYETPFDQMLRLRDHVAFYPDRATLTLLDQ